jgi:RimJ/RimL family protein N-acetyltransferase
VSSSRTLAPAFPVETDRLLLRPLEPADVDALVAYRSLPEVCRYVPFEPMTAEVVGEKLATMWSRRTIDDEGQNLNLGVELRDVGRLVGDVMLVWHSREHGGGEIGYVFHPDSAGKGYATEAVHAILHLGFDDLGLHRLMARIDARNDASGRVCERLGMRAEALLIENEWFKGEWTDEVDYAILSDEWDRRELATGCPRC